MPGAPEESVQDMDTDKGQISMHGLNLAERETAYIATYTDYPESVYKDRDNQSILDDVRDGILVNPPGTLLSEAVISLDGHPGRDITYEINDGQITFRARVYLVGNRLYQMLAGTTTDKASNSDIGKFLESFTLSDG